MPMDSVQLQRVRAFSQVGLKIQEALNVEDILRLIGEGLKELGLNCVILFLDEEQKNLKIEYTSLAPSLVAKLEKLVGL
ncbi:MAG TPA: hypothetical protein VJ441_00175, partial [Dehalococcoidia bacterium]|nr:hypothetical protein [Dehalococcoidia bacterium]